MAPTFETPPHVVRDWARLTPANRRRFSTARDALVEDLKAGKGFRPGLRIKGVDGVDGVFEMTWAPDGRATFAYGPEVIPGETHIVWRRVGTHDILRQP